MLEYIVAGIACLFVLYGVFRRIDDHDNPIAHDTPFPRSVRPLPISFYLLSFYMPAVIFGLIIWEKENSFIFALLMSVSIGSLFFVLALVCHTIVLESRGYRPPE